MVIRRRTAIAASFAAAACRRASTPLGSVTIRRFSNYQQEFVAPIRAILRDHAIQVKDKRVVLKPNLVEFDPAAPINTNPLLVLAAMEALTAEGAASVRIAEGPGHRRATLDLCDAAGYFRTIRNFEANFTDLNWDATKPFRPAIRHSPLDELHLPATILDCDLLVSMPKLKTHHWVGATLSMKNLFGIVPGGIYGWPKNPLHWAGIANVIAELEQIPVPRFAIVDGIDGMEGNGPIQGTLKHAGVLIAGADLAAVDAACCRVMGIDPHQIPYLKLARPATDFTPKQLAETVESVRTNFALSPGFEGLRLP
jgi:uncharacterized protein (DUF362 family)